MVFISNMRAASINTFLLGDDPDFKRCIHFLVKLHGYIVYSQGLDLLFQSDCLAIDQNAVLAQRLFNILSGHGAEKTVVLPHPLGYGYARGGNPLAKVRRRLAAEARQRLSAATRDLKARLAEAEKRMAASEARVEELSQQLADPQVYQDPERAARLGRELGQAKAGLERLGQEWAEAVLALEEASEKIQAQEEGEDGKMRGIF